MAKKPSIPESAMVVDKEILQSALQSAKRAAESERPPVVVPCVICGGDAAPTSNESLCWVCRRLKISAWRDVDPQIPAQE